MCAPIISRKYQVTVGGVKIPRHLERPWMEERHRTWLSSTERLDSRKPEDAVGANFAISRDVLDKVPGFDIELGPGALGFGGESLFFSQVREAGYHVTTALDIAVEHHFDKSRLLRSAFLDRSTKAGQSGAYIAYHWEHLVIKYPRLRLIKSIFRLAYLRLRKRDETDVTEGMPQWEMSGVYTTNFLKQYLKERRRGFNYEKHGLVKREECELTVRTKSQLTTPQTNEARRSC
jgi:hypothetical protein